LLVFIIIIAVIAALSSYASPALLVLTPQHCFSEERGAASSSGLLQTLHRGETAKLAGVLVVLDL